MNTAAIPQSAMPLTLKDVVDPLVANPVLSDTRKRDLRSAVVIYGKLKGEALSAIPLDLVAMRGTLDGMVPAQAKVSRKRWSNLRSDLPPPSMPLGCNRCSRPPTSRSSAPGPHSSTP